ncbi:MAG: zinc-dependent metalloprotease [Actinomycetes bacterium]
MPALPFIDATVAATVGARLVPPGPALTPGEAAEVVAGLRTAALASVAPVAEVTRLEAPAGGAMLVIDRASWVRTNVEMTMTMLAEAAGRPCRCLSGQSTGRSPAPTARSSAVSWRC